MTAELVGNVAMVQNLDGEYGLMDKSGNMLIEFGDMTDNSYNGMDWKDTYSFNDTFCIVTVSSSGSSVRLFPN